MVFSGLIDGYYSLNFNHPASRANQLRNFDVKANELSLNMLKATAELAPEPLGFRVDLALGRAFDIVHAADTGPRPLKYLEQAYLSYKPRGAAGLQFDFGKFVTTAGAEVIETEPNWNYSRSLLFAWAIPYYHTGVRATMPVNGHFSLGAQFVNGWNNVEDNNSNKTAGFTGTITGLGVTWTNTYYTGVETGARRHLYDTVLLYAPAPQASLYLNLDHGTEGGNRWFGVAGAFRYAPFQRFAIAPRVEWFHDEDGFATGTAQRLKEVTLTAEYRLHEAQLGRLEFRRDWSDAPFFHRGAGPELARSQATVLAGLVARFGGKR